MCVCVREYMCLCVIMGWCLKIKPSLLRLQCKCAHVVAGSPEGRIPCPVLLLESWLPWQQQHQRHALDGTWYLPNLWSALLQQWNPALPHPPEVCRHWLMRELFKRFFCPLLKKHYFVYCFWQVVIVEFVSLVALPSLFTETQGGGGLSLAGAATPASPYSHFISSSPDTLKLHFVRVTCQSRQSYWHWRTWSRVFTFTSGLNFQAVGPQASLCAKIQL